MVRSFAVHAAALLLAAAAPGCSSSGALPATSAPQPATGPTGGRVITASAIAQSAARNAWEVVRDLGGNLSWRESSSGDPRTVRSRRGRSSIVNASADTPQLIVDGVRVNDYRMLRQIPASAIERVRVLGAIEATTYFGTGSVGGAIIIETKND